ncbi:hypothetical protein RchiOBHm_Chr1g0365171 [Rosa chinensis]|uniref:Uncharacterized protein n=1 Tax=Rosa chinensis TaxID=74649 RepID=A0A2P6SK03_ROSCH|nr:hypothetical protein RchiOBHm_Chr1g0365171 [Rosa chinensis]
MVDLNKSLALTVAKTMMNKTSFSHSMQWRTCARVWGVRTPASLNSLLFLNRMASFFVPIHVILEPPLR